MSQIFPDHGNGVGYVSSTYDQLFLYTVILTTAVHAVNIMMIRYKTLVQYVPNPTPLNHLNCSNH